MKKAEIVLGAIAVIAILMNFFLISGGGILTIVSLSSLWLMYCFFGIALLNNIRLRSIGNKEAFQDVSKYQKVGAVGAGIALSAVILGILYKVLMWPGSQVTLYSGLIMLSIVFVVSLIKKSKSKASLYSNVIKRSVIIGLIGFFWFGIPTKTYLEFKYRNHPGYVEAMKKMWEDPGNQELQDALWEEQKNFMKQNEE